MLMKIVARTLTAAFLLASFAIHSEASVIRPFAMKVVTKPTELVPGQRHVFTIEIINKSRTTLTISSLYAFTWSVDWNNRDGSRQGTFSGMGSKMIIGTDLNPSTGEITCKYLHYEKSDFITIPARASKRFDVVVEIPSECDAARADVTIDFESKYDGSEVGIKAWTGKAQSLKLRIPVSKDRIGKLAIEQRTRR